MGGVLQPYLLPGLQMVVVGDLRTTDCHKDLLKSLHSEAMLKFYFSLNSQSSLSISRRLLFLLLIFFLKIDSPEILLSQTTTLLILYEWYGGMYSEIGDRKPNVE